MKFQTNFQYFQSRYRLIFTVLFLITAAAIFQNCGQSDQSAWRTYRHDSQRSNITAESVTPPLHLRWSFTPQHPPKPAWSKPAEELPRMHFDNALHVSVAHGCVYFGSATDNQVYALDQKSGEIQWRFFTEGPVRFAPTVWQDKVYFGSDDGFVYCVDARNGEMCWKYRPGPGSDKILGNSRMISRWPIRTSILVDDNVVYFAAGIFPYEGLYLCALQAENGKPVWKNDTFGDHVHEQKYGGISPQGYLIASEKTLYVPSGRAMPAAFNRQTGQFVAYLNPGGKVGGTWGLIAEGQLIAGVDREGVPAKVIFDDDTGEQRGDAFASFSGIELALTPDIAFTLTEEGIFAINRARHDSSNQQLNEIQREQDQLRGDIQRASRKLLLSDTNKKEELEQKIERLSTDYDLLVAREDSLENTICQWHFHHRNLKSMILTRDVLYAGGQDTVFARNVNTGQPLWQHHVQGSVLGLAATSGDLLVSTEPGPIYCFGEEPVSSPVHHLPQQQTRPYPEDELTELYQDAAKSMLAHLESQVGYALVLDCGTGRLAYELARQSGLKIIGIENDPKKRQLARERLTAAGLYGARIVVEPWAPSELPDYFANLIVSDNLLISGEISASPQELFRLLKPSGGIALFGQPEQSSQSKKNFDLAKISTWQNFPNAPQPEIIQTNGKWVKFTRAALAGAGGWTHQYGNPENTCCSDDELVKGPLGVLWFGAPGPDEMVERHAKAVAPVALDGRLFVQGEEVVMAYDAYNGTLLWKRAIPGAVRVRADVDGGNLAVTSDGLFIAVEDKCLRLDPGTGKTIMEYSIPQSGKEKPGRWGYLACVGKTVYGTTAKPLNQEYNAIWKESVSVDQTWKNTADLPAEYTAVFDAFVRQCYPEPDESARAAFQRNAVKWAFITDFPAWDCGIYGQKAAGERLMAGNALFALDVESGNLKWIYRGKRIANIGISISGNQIYLAEDAVSGAQKTAALKESRRLTQQGKWEESQFEVKPENIDVRMIHALDRESGKKLWSKPLDLTGCGGDALASAFQDDVLLFFGSVGLHDKWRFPGGELSWHRVTALSTTTREVLWSRPLNYMTRPLIIGDQVIIEPRACDLRTGQTKTRRHPVTGKEVPWEFYRPGHTCAGTAATRDGLFYRSYCAAFYDLEKDNGLTYFGAIRPGCWINMIPANGLLLFPEASSGCTCSFPLRTTVVLNTRPETKSGNWSVYLTHGAMTPVKHLAINLGAPGDRKDANGTVWFGYPRPGTSYGVKFNLHEKVLPEMGFFASDIRNKQLKNTGRPWLFQSGCLGLAECQIPLIDDVWGEKPARYTVRLGFLPPAGDRPGQRLFDLKIQDQPVLSGLDLAKLAETGNEVVMREFSGILVSAYLKIAFEAKNNNPANSQAPIINFIEVVREDTVAASSEHPQFAKILSTGAIENLLKQAKRAQKQTHHTHALDLFHRAFDGAPSENLKIQALEGLTGLANPLSLNRIEHYFRYTAPILWEYKPPPAGLINAAIQLLIVITEKTADEHRGRAVKMLNNALDITRDFEIRQQIVTLLDKLDCQIDADARKEGFLTRWHLCGYFPWDLKKNTLSKKFVNEPDIDLTTGFQVDGRTQKWTKFVNAQGKLDIIKTFGAHRKIAIYAYTEFTLNQSRELVLKIGSDDGFRCWLNGEEVGCYDDGRGFALDQDILRIQAQTGVNRLLLKVFNWNGGSGFSVRLVDLQGKVAF